MNSITNPPTKENDSAIVFGHVLKYWFDENEWPQIVAEDVARAKEHEIGPWASQISNAMAGKLEPKPNFFKAMGWFNLVIFTEDFDGITDRRLLDRLKDSEALCHKNTGAPYSGTDFFSLYIGELLPPRGYTKRVPTRELMETITQRMDAGHSKDEIVTRGLIRDLQDRLKDGWID